MTLPLIREIDLRLSIAEGCAIRRIVREAEAERARAARARDDRSQRLRALAMFGVGA